MRILALLLGLLPLAACQYPIPDLGMMNLTNDQIGRYLFKPQNDIAYGQCLSVPFKAAQAGFNTALGIDVGITWRQSNTLTKAVNNILLKTNDGLNKVCSARQQYAQSLAMSYPFCVNRYFLLSQGDTDFTNVAYYVHLFKHLEFICSAGYDAYAFNMPCISRTSDPTNAPFQQCYTDFSNAVGKDPNGFCTATETFIQCIQTVFTNACDMGTGWVECELERVGFAYDCPNTVCTV